MHVLDDLITGQTANLEHIQPAPELVVGDVGVRKRCGAPRPALSSFFISRRWHRCKRASRSGRDAPACATGTVNVLNAARKSGVRRVVYAGSARAYGLPSGDVQSETDPLRALSPYAAAKLAGEFYAQSFSAALGLETATVRFFDIYGPRRRRQSLFRRDRAVRCGPDGRADADHFRRWPAIAKFRLRRRCGSGPNQGRHSASVSGQVYNVEPAAA